ncbi:MAG: hypothetical protein QM781_04390 [Chitinophagaceae bacterium]
MKSIFLFAISFCHSSLLMAQVKPATTPALKQTQIAKADTNIARTRQVPAGSAIKLITPVTLTENLLFHQWKGSRWVNNSLYNGYLYANFTFNPNGTVSCTGSIISSANNQLLSGTYTVNDNNVTIIIKKDTSEILTCNLVYDKAAKKLNGSYIYQILHGYAAGNIAQGEMKLEKSQK